MGYSRYASFFRYKMMLQNCEIHLHCVSSILSSLILVFFTSEDFELPLISVLRARNSRAERLIGRNTLRGLARVGGYVGVALTLMLLIAAASYRRGRPELARSIEYYESH